MVGWTDPYEMPSGAYVLYARNAAWLQSHEFYRVINFMVVLAHSLCLAETIRISKRPSTLSTTLFLVNSLRRTRYSRSRLRGHAYTHPALL